MTAAEMFSYLLQTSLAVSVLIGLVLLVRRPVANAFGAKATYSLWAIPLIRLILPPVPANWTLFGALGFGSPQTAVARNTAPTGDAEVFAELVLMGAGTPERSGVISDASLWMQLSDLLPPLLPTLLLIWALGAAMVFGQSMLRQLGTARLIKAEAKDAGPLLQTCAMDVGQTIGLKPGAAIIQTSFISSGPLVSGLVRPTVLLPAWFEEDYTGEQQRLAITHEMMHIKRRDLWALLAASLAIALQWFNPLAWFALGVFRLDQEAACDADVLSCGDVSPHNYGATLVKAVRISGPVAQPVHAASLPLNHALYERLTQMKNPLPTTSRQKAGTLLTASAGAVALLLSACAASAAQTAELAGAPDAEVQAEAEVRTIIINEEVVEVDETSSDPETRVRIIARRDGADLDQSEHSSVFFVGSEGGVEMAELTQEFSEEMRRLHTAEGDHSAEIAALERDFEARVEEVTREYFGDHDVRVMRFEGDAEWTEHGDTHVECSDGEGRTRTVTIERNGETTQSVISSCGHARPDIDLDEIMASLRNDGRLTEERLAEVEIKLAEAKAKLAELDFDTDMDFDFDFDFDFDDDDLDIEIDGE